MEARPPGVFISSTFYDLRQVRADLAHFIQDQLGYRFLMSEHSSFPVDPSLSTIENCRRRVENEADILVLIVGARYGSIAPDSSRSVTNLEYLTAKAKGIPIYAFIARDVLALLPIWERNPDADFTGVVDSPKLLAFVRELRGTDGVWTFPFELAQEIITTLRTQLAYQMMRGLQLGMRTRHLDPLLRSLSGEAFRLVAERPVAWEALLFARRSRTNAYRCANCDAITTAPLQLGRASESVPRRFLIGSTRCWTKSCA
ncbi:MAG: DUF4062 domain-containing protein [Acidobacteria bacterium]|nr:DUF4062 domain-containing protein [Acidobacteriota bacterium]